MLIKPSASRSAGNGEFSMSALVASLLAKKDSAGG